MQVAIGHGTLELVAGDITQQTTDAIVNAANSSLAGGGGVDGAIHRGGGPSIMAETRARYPRGCPTGDAVLTGAGNLPARYVIHAVGPIWRGGHQGEPQQLANAYRRSLQLAVDNGCQSVALPALSTGAYGYPVELAAHTALRTVWDFLRAREEPLQVRFVLFDAATQDVFVAALEALQTE